MTNNAMEDTYQHKAKQLLDQINIAIQDDESDMIVQMIEQAPDMMSKHLHANDFYRSDVQLFLRRLQVDLNSRLNKYIEKRYKDREYIDYLLEYVGIKGRYTKWAISHYIREHFNDQYILNNNAYKVGPYGDKVVTCKDKILHLATGISINGNYKSPKIIYHDQMMNIPNKAYYTDMIVLIQKLKSKQIKIQNSKYRNLSKLFNNLIQDKGFAYPATYGIGLEYTFNWNFKEQQALITAKLQELGIDYTCEFSDAKWIFRYKISKNQKNLQKITQL